MYMHEDALYFTTVLRCQNPARNVPSLISGRNIKILCFFQANWFGQCCLSILSHLAVLGGTDLETPSASDPWRQFSLNPCTDIVPSRSFCCYSYQSFSQLLFRFAHGFRPELGDIESEIALKRHCSVSICIYSAIRRTIKFMSKSSVGDIESCTVFNR